MADKISVTDKYYKWRLLPPPEWKSYSFGERYGYDQVCDDMNDP